MLRALRRMLILLDKCWYVQLIALVAFMLLCYWIYERDNPADWVQAIGSIFAIIAAVGVVSLQNRMELDRSRREKLQHKIEDLQKMKEIVNACDGSLYLFRCNLVGDDDVYNRMFKFEFETFQRQIDNFLFRLPTYTAIRWALKVNARLAECIEYLDDASNFETKEKRMKQAKRVDSGEKACGLLKTELKKSIYSFHS